MRVPLILLTLALLPPLARAQSYIESSYSPLDRGAPPIRDDEPAPPLSPAVLARVSKGVVLIERLDDDGRSLGSACAFIDSRGLVITNRHCIEGASSIKLNLGPLGLFNLPTLICESTNLDIAILKGDFPPSTIVPLEWSTSGPLRRHTPVSVVVRSTEGAIESSPGWSDTFVFDKDGALLQSTSAPAWYGCSGSPLVNDCGQVVGVVNRLGSSRKLFAYQSTARAATADDVLALKIDAPLPFVAGKPANPDALQEAKAARTWAWRINSREPDAAIDYARSATRRLPHDINSRFIVVDLLDAQQKPDDATAEVAAILAENDDNPLAFLHAGHRQFHLRKYPDALAAYSKSITVRPTAVAWYWLADCMWQNKDYSGAAAAYEESIRLEPRCTQSWQNLLRLYENLAKPEECVRIIKHQLTLEPNDPALLAQLATAQLKADQRPQHTFTLGTLRPLNPYLANRAELPPAPQGAYPPPYETP